MKQSVKVTTYSQLPLCTRFLSLPGQGLSEHTPQSRVPSNPKVHYGSVQGSKAQIYRIKGQSETKVPLGIPCVFHINLTDGGNRAQRVCDVLKLYSKSDSGELEAVVGHLLRQALPTLPNLSL